MNFLDMEDDDSAGFRLPTLMKSTIEEVRKKKKLKSNSLYIKKAVNRQLLEDLEKQQ